MSKYSTGAVQVTIGSSLIKGTSTDFSTYAAQGYLFKLNSEAVYYEIAAVTNGTNLNLTSNYANANYSNGSTLSAMPYSIVTDYTTNYSFPELSPNDTGITYTYTKAMRKIDQAIYNASIYTMTCASDIEVTASNRGAILYSQDGTPWRITVSNTGTILTASNPT